ncbi:MAG: hypothetical protein EAZ91_12000 [Cytophagales bacterium]|nr:MAG: hypothetical protein EAZ91_12000 [Cytophagales bacterium]
MGFHFRVACDRLLACGAVGWSVARFRVTKRTPEKGKLEGFKVRRSVDKTHAPERQVGATVSALVAILMAKKQCNL